MALHRNDLEMSAINKRSIGVSILLSIFTFGIYVIYWQYLLVKNVKTIKHDTTSCAVEMLCLIFVPFYSLYWWYTRGEAVKQEFLKQNRSVTSNGFTVYSNPARGFVICEIVAQPQNKTVKAGANAVFSVTARSDKTFYYQWQYRTTSSGSWTNVTDAITGNLTLTGVTAAMNGYQYRCKFDGSGGLVVTNPATLTVK